MWGEAGVAEEDMLDADANTGGLCVEGPNRAETRRVTGGAIAAFFRWKLQDDDVARGATVVGVIHLARAIGMDVRRQTAAGLLVAVSPLMIGNLVETRFDMALSALLVWTLWAAATERCQTRTSSCSRRGGSNSTSIHRVRTGSWAC